MSTSAPLSRVTPHPNGDQKRATLTPEKDNATSALFAHSKQLPRIFVVDRDSMSSDLMAKALASERKCIAVAIRPSDLLQQIATREIDVVVIGADQSSELGSGFDLASAVARVHPKTCIILLLNEPTHSIVVQAFRCGARGVFSRQEPISEFLACIEHVCKGYIWAGKEETNFLLEAFRSIPSPMILGGIPTLTTRELEVVRCASTGRTNKAIAISLGLSEHTVKNYLFRAFEKLGVSSRVELLFYLTNCDNSFSNEKPE